jgi:alkylated DNA repair dioxygenase AlkB
MKSRKTSSYGEPYVYSNVNYNFIPFPIYISQIAEIVKDKFGFLPNNCLINYYNESNSRMGFHSDQIDILQDDTGIAIISLGDKRTMRFKNKLDSKIIYDIVLEPNSLFYMSKLMQISWLHSILPDNDSLNSERISITFRKLKGN